MPAPKLRPTSPRMTATPPVMYSQAWLPVPSTTAVVAAPESDLPRSARPEGPIVVADRVGAYNGLACVKRHLDVVRHFQGELVHVSRRPALPGRAASRGGRPRQDVAQVELPRAAFDRIGNRLEEVRAPGDPVERAETELSEESARSEEHTPELQSRS